MLKFSAAAAALIVISVSAGVRSPIPIAAPTPTGWQYVSPLPNSAFNTPQTTVAVRQGEPIAPDSVSTNVFNVVGSSSGEHTGTAVLADDHATVIFKPDQPFALGETVQVAVSSGLRTTSGQSLNSITFNFTIFSAVAPLPPLAAPSPDSTPTTAPSAAQQPAPAPAIRQTTLPSNLPMPIVNTAGPADSGEDFFVGAFPFPQGSANELEILDSSGQPVYYQDTGAAPLDVKVQPNGLLTYYANGTFYELDHEYNVVDSFQAGNGYGTDLHDLQLLPNGHALLMIYDPEYVDMGQVVLGGNSHADVTGLVIQELDASKNVVFQWRSWDHFLLTDSYEDLTQPIVDDVHGNAIQPDTDGNILISSRHLSEITKINRQTGQVMWRWGGKHNEFTFVNDNTVPPFYYQHDIRRLPNGDITLFDNRTGLTPRYSEALEYKLDEVNKTATLVWQYRHTPDLYALAMGNVQLLPNGNRVIDWGTAGVITELSPNGTVAAEFTLPTPYASYRAFVFPWNATPMTPPVLRADVDGSVVTLTYSWNGATEVTGYRVYGGSAPHPTQLLATQGRAGFDTQTVLALTLAQCEYYRVQPVDRQGNPTPYSNEVTACPQ